jgi:hypothetical protein
MSTDYLQKRCMRCQKVKEDIDDSLCVSCAIRGSNDQCLEMKEFTFEQVSDLQRDWDHQHTVSSIDHL